MAVDLSYFTGIETAFTAALTAVGGALTAWGVLRRRLSADALEIAKDRGEATWIRDMREMGRMEAKLNAAETMIQFLQDKHAEYIVGRERQFGACEERVRSLGERNLDLDLANKRLYAALREYNEAEADELMLLQLRPVPPGTEGNAPP